MTETEDYRDALKAVQHNVERAGHGEDWAILRREPNCPVWWLDWIAMGDFLPAVWQGTTAEEAANQVKQWRTAGTYVLDWSHRVFVEPDIYRQQIKDFRRIAA